ncbi:MAG: protoheme IX farnesyltransferase [Verrucomicrobia bacterium]|nr:protoheme IX farnesyltransferase [Verrucomicrobiota bacterium]
MKATAPTFAVSAATGKSAVAIWSELFKARLTSLVVLTALAGFYMGSAGGMSLRLLLPALAGTALLACGAAALNQWWERDYDGLMPRTAGRPLPAGLLRADIALAAGVATAVAGLALLATAVNPLTAALGAATLGLYLFVYTPLKRTTPLNTIVGAVPGALPPLMGWTAARGEVTREGLALFALQFFWQLPHFLAIAWLYREQYERAGFKMLPGVDSSGERTARHAVAHALALLPVSLCPALFGMAGRVYFAGALVAGAVFVWHALQFSRELSRERARRMFFVSLVYLPLVLGLMALDRLAR